MAVLVGAVLGLLVALQGSLAAAPAENDDPFSATVRVDASADNVVNARELARLDGQRRALSDVIGRLTGGADPAKQPKLDDKSMPDKTITDMVASFEVANERMSAVRYMADYTFHFRPAEVKRVLRSAGIAFAEGAAKPAVLLPLYQGPTGTVLWDDPNPWRDAWAQRPAGTGLVRLTVPLGDASDATAIDAAQARAGNPDALTAIARKNGADEVVVALATPRRQGEQLQGIDVSVKRYRLGQLVDSQSKSIDANPGESRGDFLRRAADATASDIESGWKKSNVLRYDQQGSLTAAIPITGLDDWIQIRDRLTAVPAIRKVGLMSLTRDRATVEIFYLGTIEQLKAALAEISFDLVRGDASWQLARSGALPAH